MRPHLLPASLLALCALTGCAKTEPQVIAVEPDLEPVAYERLTLVPTDAVGTFVGGTGVVSDIYDARSFWLGTGDDRILAVIANPDDPDPALDLEVGDRVQMTAVVLDADGRDDLAGELEADTLAAIAGADRFLATHRRWITILEEDAVSDGDPDGLTTQDIVSVVVDRGVHYRPVVDDSYVVVDFDTWDSNGDDGIDRVEFAAGLAMEGDLLMEGFDTDADGQISVDEFHAGMLDVMDRNNDGEIVAGRFWSVLHAWRPEPDIEAWQTWDADADGTLDLAELEIALGGDEGLWRDFATDAASTLPPGDFTNGLFDTWDLDHDGVLAPAEFRRGTHQWYSQFEGEARFVRWDLSGDGTLDPVELVAGMESWRDAWDFDDSGVTTQAEMLAGLFLTFDADTDGVLSDWEFDDAWFHGDADEGFGAWDLDDDGSLTLMEFETRLASIALSDAWDTDGSGVLSAEELAQGLFDRWDVDGDGDLDLPEYRGY